MLFYLSAFIQLSAAKCDPCFFTQPLHFRPEIAAIYRLACSCDKNTPRFDAVFFRIPAQLHSKLWRKHHDSMFSIFFTLLTVSPCTGDLLPTLKVVPSQPQTCNNLSHQKTTFFCIFHIFKHIYKKKFRNYIIILKIFFIILCIFLIF